MWGKAYLRLPLVQWNSCVNQQPHKCATNNFLTWIWHHLSSLFVVWALNLNAVLMSSVFWAVKEGLIFMGLIGESLQDHFMFVLFLPLTFIKVNTLTHKGAMSAQQRFIIITLNHKRCCFKHSSIWLSSSQSHIRRGHHWSVTSVGSVCDVMLSMRTVPTTPVYICLNLSRQIVLRLKKIIKRDSKSARLSFCCGAQKKIFWRMFTLLF